MQSKFITQFIKYFFRGLLFTAPIFVTFYVIIASLNWIDGLVQIDIPGIGFLIIILSITTLGALASTVFSKPILDFLVNVMENIPVVNTIYTSLKDVVSAFVGDNKKFESAVLVTFDKELQIKRIGFVTQRDLSKINQTGMVSVYIPDSYGITGNLFIVSENSIEVIDQPVSEVMKFVVSGGITKMNK